jgi:DNA-binding MarR family transcriptional regulator
MLNERLLGVFEEVCALANELRKDWREGQADSTGLGGRQRVLEILDRCGPRTVPEIARARGNSRQNIQVLVNRLVLEECVEITSNPAHQKSGLVHLTERGKRALAAAMERDERVFEALSRQISNDALLSTSELLREIRLFLGGQPPGPGLSPAAESTGRRRRGRPPVTRTTSSLAPGPPRSASSVSPVPSLKPEPGAASTSDASTIPEPAWAAPEMAGDEEFPLTLL